MNKCKDCKFFGEEIIGEDWPDIGDAIEIPTGFHTCDRIKHADCAYYDLYKISDEACVQDGSGYFAALRVKDDFGCVMFEKKDTE